jgi:hypothetical protein
MSAAGPIGTMQGAPIPPSGMPISEDAGFSFMDATSGHRFDPPITSAYQFAMMGQESVFSGIMDFPTGFEDPFEVMVDGESLGL